MLQSQREERKPLTIRGYVSLIEEDSAGSAITAVITTDDDEEYLISSYGEGEELLDYVDEYVEITGFLLDHEGEESFVVRRFRMLAGEGDEEHHGDRQDGGKAERKS